tara:strand:- start:1540 stop:1686 length:147 start_codon:yes stop_codon:yes gene_type:complete
MADRIAASRAARATLRRQSDAVVVAVVGIVAMMVMFFFAVFIHDTIKL